MGTGLPVSIEYVDLRIRNRPADGHHRTISLCPALPRGYVDGRFCRPI